MAKTAPKVTAPTYTMPARLTGTAADIWAETAPHVQLDTPMDVEALAQYCEQGEVYANANAEVQAHYKLTGSMLFDYGNQNIGEHKGISIAKNASVQMRLLRDTLKLNTAKGRTW